jgi:hypothetical protein
MDVNRILAALRQEREQLDAVILNLEHLEQSREHRRGRPPAILTAARKRGRPRGSKNRTPRVSPQFAGVAEHPAVRAMAAGQSVLLDESSHAGPFEAV